MNLKALRYVCLGIDIPDFLFVQEHRSSSSQHIPFCTTCKKVTRHFNFIDDESSHYCQKVHVKCHNWNYKVPITEGDLEKHKKLFRDIYWNENDYGL